MGLAVTGRASGLVLSGAWPDGNGAAVRRLRHDVGFVRLMVLGVSLLVLTLGGLALHFLGGGVLSGSSSTALFVTLLGLTALVYFGAVALVLRDAPRHGIWVVLVVAVLVRLGPLLAPPFLSSDVYRYVWDGRVQAAGINPYAYVPADPALAGLRDRDIFPEINRAEMAPTIYPPAAQAVFAAIGMAAPGVKAVKVAMVAFEVLAVAAASVVLRRASLPAAWIVIWAWNPLAIWEFAGSGHIDAAAAGLLALALMLVEARGILAGVVFGAAVLTKFLPLAVAPALWPRGGWRTAGAALLAVLVLYGCYASVGLRVLGYLSGYGTEEGLADGTGYWLLAGLSLIVPLSSSAARIYLVLAVFVLGMLGSWIAFIRRPSTDEEIWRAAGLLMAGVTVAISPHYPWYFVWLALPAIVAPSRALIWLSAAPALLYDDPFKDRFIWSSLIYLPAVALALADRRWPLVVVSCPTGDSACPQRT